MNQTSASSIASKRTLAVIPARGGSKRLQGKNIKLLAGRPLISHTIQAAADFDQFDQILVSTDDDKIADVASEFPSVTIDKRDAALANDHAKVADVILEICQRPQTRQNFDAIALLLPTAPFRELSKLREGYDRLSRTCDSVVSVCEYGFPPAMAVHLTENTGTFEPMLDPCPLLTGNTRSQDHNAAYHPNGSFYFSWIDSFLKNRSFFVGRVVGVPMHRYSSVDIDTLEDLQMAELLVTAGLAKSDFI